MRLEIVDSLGRLERIKKEWSGFAAMLERLTPFQLPDWLLTWWRHFGSGNLHVIIFRENGAMAGIIPCFLHEWNGQRQLTLIGSGISDYLEPAIAQEYRLCAVELLRSHLIENRDWDTCDWQDLAAGSPLAGLAPLEDDAPCSEVKLTDDFDEYWGRRSTDLRRNLRRYTQRAEPSGRIEFMVTGSAESGLIDELVHLHGDRWHKRGESGMIAANNAADFLHEIAQEFERLHMFRIYSLRFRGQVAAILIGFLYRNTLYAYLSAFDPQYQNFGFGRKLLYESLRHAYEHRYTAWNFCRGDEPYKFSFGAEVIPKRRLILTRPSPYTA